ncbi:lysozyme inhibitor LprI family protein [Sphingomonas sp. ac-8]|uniref:lysozyme inhibitor LprI family protein n=1 Tax=Sphingomonas sp. ac-8 TaxID=3242977 RepID=UPI003A808BB1
MKVALLTAGLLVSGSAALAQDDSSGLSPRYLACQARAGNNTVQSGICAQAEMTSQDARLNKAYQQVMRQLASKPQEKIALRNYQRSWLRQRDYECKVDQETINSTCLVAKTATRANELEEQIRF